MLYMSKDIAKLATLESQKEVVCTTHLRNLKKRKAIKGYKRRRNQRDRDRHAAESARLYYAQTRPNLRRLVLWSGVSDANRPLL